MEELLQTPLVAGLHICARRTRCAMHDMCTPILAIFTYGSTAVCRIWGIGFDDEVYICCPRHPLVSFIYENNYVASWGMNIPINVYIRIYIDLYESIMFDVQSHLVYYYLCGKHHKVDGPSDVSFNMYLQFSQISYRKYGRLIYYHTITNNYVDPVRINTLYTSKYGGMLPSRAIKKISWNRWECDDGSRVNMRPDLPLEIENDGYKHLSMC